MIDLAVSMDRSAAAAINGLAGNGWADAAVELASCLGNGWFTFALLIPLLVLFAGRRRAVSILTAAALSLMAGSVIVHALKHAVPRARPAADPVIGPRIQDLSGGLRAQSFPSGHAQTAFAAATVVAMEAGPAAGGIALFLAALVGFSRVYMGAHFPSDVAAGAVIGAGASFFIAWILRKRKL
jgi:undecaprenyl-diphosphatase